MATAAPPATVALRPLLPCPVPLLPGRPVRHPTPTRCCQAAARRGPAASPPPNSSPQGTMGFAPPRNFVPPQTVGTEQTRRIPGPPHPDLRRHDFFMTRAPELSTLSLGPVFRPGSFSVGPGAQCGPPGGRNREKPAVVIFSRRRRSGKEKAALARSRVRLGRARRGARGSDDANPDLRRREKIKAAVFRYFGLREGRIGPRDPQKTTRGGKPVPGMGSRAPEPASQKNLDAGSLGPAPPHPPPPASELTRDPSV